MRMAKQRKTWVFSPPKPFPRPVPDDLKAEVERKAGALVEEFLKPEFIKPPPKNWRWNYIIDTHSKWHRLFFYFIATYRSRGPTAIRPTFEAPFARLEYVGHPPSTSPTCGTPASGGRSTRASPLWLTGAATLTTIARHSPSTGGLRSPATLQGGQAWTPPDPAAAVIAPAGAGTPAGGASVSPATSAFPRPLPWFPGRSRPAPAACRAACRPGPP
jgi:hypothetical protein